MRERRKTKEVDERWRQGVRRRGWKRGRKKKSERRVEVSYCNCVEAKRSDLAFLGSLVFSASSGPDLISIAGTDINIVITSASALFPRSRSLSTRCRGRR